MTSARFPRGYACRPAGPPPAVPADVPAALDKLGIGYVLRGDEAVAPCPDPEHDDRSPSWSCNTVTGVHHCFSCGFGGSFDRLAAAVRGVRPGEARAWVRALGCRRAPLPGQPAPEPFVSEAALWEAADPPHEELTQRGITLTAARAMEIRWHPRRNRWIFPVRDGGGRLLGWQEKDGRVMVNRPRDIRKSRAVFGYAHLAAHGSGETVAVTESPLDAARFEVAGTAAVALFGSSFSEEQQRLLWPVARELVLAFDNDTAGHRAAAAWIRDNPAMRRHARVFSYGGIFRDRAGRYVHPAGDGRDPGDLPGDALRAGVAHATPAWNTWFEGVTWWD